MATGTDLLTLNEAPGTGPVSDDFQVFGKLPGMPNTEYRVPASRLKGAGGGAAVAPITYTVSLANGKTMGTFKSGDIIEEGTAYDHDFFYRALVENILPTYVPASVSVSQSAPANGEVGESIANTITGVFNRGDGGALLAMRAYRGNQAQAGASASASPIVRTVQMVRALTPSGIWVVADYAAGAPKPVPPANTTDTRPAQVRNPDAPQAAEIGLSSSIIYYTGYYLLFYGPTTATPTDRASALALGSSQLVTGGGSAILNTGTSALKLAIVLPPGHALQSVTDLDNQQLNLTAKYVAQPTISIADASGTLVPGYTPYVLSIATPYTASARHQFSYA
jgi:hypothetical protein